MLQRHSQFGGCGFKSLYYQWETETHTGQSLMHVKFNEVNIMLEVQWQW